MPGVLAHSVINNESYFLLGKERGGKDKGTWCILSGGKDPQDPSNLMAACREAHEESAGLLGKIDSIAKKVIPLNGSHHTFLLEVKDPSKITNEKFKAARATYKDPHYREMTDLKWVKAADVIDACVKNKGFLTIDGKNERVRPFASKMIAHNAPYLKKKFVKENQGQIVQPPVVQQKPNLDSKFKVRKIETQKDVDLIKKITSDWANSANFYKNAHARNWDLWHVGLDAENMALTINDRVKLSKIQNKKFSVLAAEDKKGKIWGISIVKFGSNGKTELENLVVNPKIIKAFNKNSKITGVGTFLVKEIAKRTFQKNQSNCVIELSSLPSAIDFYKKLGFKEVPNKCGANTSSQDMKLSLNGIKQLCNS